MSGMRANIAVCALVLLNGPSPGNAPSTASSCSTHHTQGERAKCKAIMKSNETFIQCVTYQTSSEGSKPDAVDPDAPSELQDQNVGGGLRCGTGSPSRPSPNSNSDPSSSSRNATGVWSQGLQSHLPVHQGESKTSSCELDKEH